MGTQKCENYISSHLLEHIYVCILPSTVCKMSNVHMYIGKNVLLHTKKTSGPNWGMRSMGEQANIFYLFQFLCRE